MQQKDNEQIKPNHKKVLQIVFSPNRRKYTIMDGASLGMQTAYLPTYLPTFPPIHPSTYHRVDLSVYLLSVGLSYLSVCMRGLTTAEKFLPSSDTDVCDLEDSTSST